MVVQAANVGAANAAVLRNCLRDRPVEQQTQPEG
jgi:hypothetical protein